MCRCRRRSLVLGATAATLLALPRLALAAGMLAGSARQSQSPPCAIRGTVTTGQVRLPGVGLSVTPEAGGPALSTSTAQDGAYAIAIPGRGVYTVVADLTGFAPVTLDVTVESSCQAQQNISLTLASRVEAPKPRRRRPRRRPQRRRARATGARRQRRFAARSARPPGRPGSREREPGRLGRVRSLVSRRASARWTSRSTSSPRNSAFRRDSRSARRETP